MELHNLTDGELLGIELDESMTYAGLRVRSADGAHARIDAISLGGIPVALLFHRLSLRAGLAAIDGTSTLGEIVSVSRDGDRMVLDGDFGCIELIAGRFAIEPVN